MARHSMPSADAAWLHMDRPENLMAITSVLWLDGAIDEARFRALLQERLVDRFPRFRQRIADGGALGGAQWEDDPTFDLDLHLHRRALPAPGDQAALQAFVGDLMGMPLDRTKPLWHMHLVEGYEGGTAVVVRMHHCIADGIALARVMLSLTDELPAGTQPAPIDPSHDGGRTLPGPLAALVPALAAGRVVSAKLMHEGVEAILHPRHVGELASGALGATRALVKELTMLPDARTPLRGELHPGERVAWCEPIPLELVKGIAHAHGATVNDVLVSAVAGGLRRWLHAHHGGEPELRAMVPFNLRPLGEPLPRELGNRFGLVLLSLPIGEQDPVERLYEVRRRMSAIKDSPEGAVSYGVLSAMGVAPPAVEARLIDLFSAKATLVLTNVPGPRHPVYLAGARVRGVLVWAPCAGSVSMSMSIFSYDDAVTVGVMTDAGLVPEPAALVDGVTAELAQLAGTVTQAAAASS